jgi:predicted RNase H-like HicB family nuclease
LIQAVAESIPIYLEVGSKRVFACAFDWPGWCRSGKSEQEAMDALSEATPRYALVAEEAGLALPAGAGESLEVVERVPGSGTTDFGAPGAVPAKDAEPLTGKEANRLAKLVEASWTILDRVAAGAPAELRKGPRGGGRDRDQVLQHVIAAEAAYARKLGVRHKEPSAGDVEAVSALRKDLLKVLTVHSVGKGPVEKGWPPRYAARRIAWHVLDHAWEIEDKSDPGGGA